MDRRDGRAMARLYDRYGRLVYATVFRIVRNQAVAEDLVQETFLRAWNRPGIFDEHQYTMGPWLLAVARNRAIDHCRSQAEPGASRAVFAENEDPRLYAGLEAGVLDAEQARRIKQSLAQMPDHHRQAIEIACFDEFSPIRMAARLGQPLVTAMASLRSALAELRRAMEAGVAP